MTTKELRKEWCELKGFNYIDFETLTQCEEYVLFLEGKLTGGSLNPEEIRIGMKLNHTTRGDIEVLGIHPHARGYCITIKEGWVYLKNCKNI